MANYVPKQPLPKDTNAYQGIHLGMKGVIAKPKPKADQVAMMKALVIATTIRAKMRTGGFMSSTSPWRVPRQLALSSPYRTCRRLKAAGGKPAGHDIFG